ncbi:MAG: ECF transporter S component [Christensenellales bacterium]
MKKHLSVKNMVLGAVLIALGVLFPQAFHMVGAGPVFLPMHIPVLLSGFVCGPVIGALAGLVTPLLSSFITGMPPIYPMAVMMMFELGAYGLFAGLLYRKSTALHVYGALIGAMLIGRAVMGVVKTILLGMAGTPFTFQIFLADAFVTAWPGIVIQLIFVPIIVGLLIRIRLIEKKQPALEA